MLLFIKISTLHGGHHYDLFYFLAIIFSLVTLIIAGKRRNYPMIPWLLSLLMILLFLILGTKIFTLSPEQWNEFFESGKIPAHTGRNILGGIAGCMLGIFISRLWFGFKNDVLDTFAYVFPVAMAIQRVGCIFAGCCFGTPTNVPWAFIYNRHTYAHAAHINNGLLDYFSPCSLPVHPYPLYQIFACIIILILLYCFFRKRVRVAGNLFLISINLYLISRVVNEFFRDPSGSGYAGIIIHGLKIEQWILIVVIIGLCIVVLVREKKGEYKTIQYQVRDSAKRNALFFMSVFIIILSLWKWLPDIEHIHIFSVSLVLGVFSLVHGFIKIKQGKWQWSMIFLIPLSLILVSFGKDDNPSTGEDKRDFFSIGTGYTGGKYDYEYSYCTGGGSDCYGNTLKTVCHNYYSEERYDVYGGGLSYTHFTEKERALLFGLNFSYNKHYEERLKDDPGIISYKFTGFNPRFIYRGKAFGFGLGLHIGDYQYENLYFSKIPQIELRLGELKYCFIAFKIADQFPGIGGYKVPVSVEIGSGFGSEKFFFSAGICNRGYLIKPSINLFKNQITLGGHYTFFDDEFHNTSSDERYKDYDKFGFNIWWNIPVK